MYSQNFTASLRKTLSFLSDNMVFVTNYPLIMLLCYWYDITSKIQTACDRCRDNNKALNSKKIETFAMKCSIFIKIIKLLPNNAPVSKEMHKLIILNLKDFITLQNILFFVYMTALRKNKKLFNTTLNKWRLTNFTIQDPLTHHNNWKEEILKQKNMITSIYWANVYQTGTPTPKCFSLKNALRSALV